MPQIAELFSNQQLVAISNKPTSKYVLTAFGRHDTPRKNKPLTDYIDSITTDWLDADRILKGWLSKNTYYT